MSLGGLTELLSSRGRAEVLRLLFGAEGRRLHVRELERQSGLALGTIREELKRLSNFGFLEKEVDGNRTYYRANRQHPIYPEIRGIVMKTSGLVEVLRSALEGEKIVAAFVFGSIARNTARADSDIDLMIIGETSLRKVSRLLAGASEALGREITPHILSLEEFYQRKGRQDHFVCSVLDTPRLFVIGSDDELEGMG